jgi:hypothetical protein
MLAGKDPEGSGGRSRGDRREGSGAAQTTTATNATRIIWLWLPDYQARWKVSDTPEPREPSPRNQSHDEQDAEANT